MPHPGAGILIGIGAIVALLGLVIISGVLPASTFPVPQPGLGCQPVTQIAFLNPCGVSIRWATPQVSTAANGTTTLTITDQSIAGENVTVTSAVLTWSPGGPTSTYTGIGFVATHRYANGVQNATVTEKVSGFRWVGSSCVGPPNTCPLPYVWVSSSLTDLIQFISPTAPPSSAFVQAGGKLVVSGLLATIFDKSSFGSVCGSPPAYSDSYGNPYVAETIAWGDGAKSSGLVPGGWAANHTYPRAGTYNVTLSLVGITWYAQQGPASCANPYTILPHLYSNVSYGGTATTPPNGNQTTTKDTGGTPGQVTTKAIPPLGLLLVIAGTFSVVGGLVLMARPDVGAVITVAGIALPAIAYWLGVLP